MKRHIRIIAIVMLLTMVVPCVTGMSTLGDEGEKETFIPLWMKPNTIITYDSNMNRSIVQGGELTESEIAGRADIALVGTTSTDPEMVIQPNIKVEYDHHGFIQNIYYAVPGKPGEYQLSNPRRARNGTGWLAAGTSHEYGEYMNYDTQSRSTNILRRDAGALQIKGWGRITFYVGGPTGETPSHNLEYYDCATKMTYCDVPSGSEVYAKNTYTSSDIVTFYKWDCGGLPAAVLDIWSDSNFNPITELTTNGTVDNVYSAYVWTFAPSGT